MSQATQENAVKAVLVTVPSAEEGAKLGRQIVEQRLAACVNVIPQIRSIYQWEGKVQDDSESLLIIKTTANLISELEKVVLKLHPYSTVEFIVLDPQHVTGKYAAWVKEVTSK